MDTLTLAGIELDTCPFCNGCWLDGEEASQLTRSRGKSRIEVKLSNPKTGELLCPRCRKTNLMVGPHEKIPTLVLDQCPNCLGVWLDRGEFPALLSYKSSDSSN